MSKITLRNARLMAGLRVETVASKLGVTASTLYRWENGKTFPDAMQISKLERLYGVKYNEIQFVLD